MRAVRMVALLALVALAACESTTSKEGVETSQSNGLVRAEVDRRISELRFLHGGELYGSLKRLVDIGEAAQPQIREGIRSDEWLTRASLAWVMGASKDRRYIPDLRGLISDPVGGVRYQAASALVELGDTAGFASLVDGLNDEDIRNRYKCLESLQRATGQDFGYAHDADPDARRAAVARWRVWLESMRSSAL